MQRVRRIAESVTAEPEIVIGEIELLSGLERSALTAANPRHVEPLTIADIFERALRQAPDGVALEENGRRLDLPRPARGVVALDTRVGGPRNRTRRRGGRCARARGICGSLRCGQ